MSNPYLLQEIDDVSIEFNTEKGLRYKVYFIDQSLLFQEYPDIASLMFSLNIDVIEGNPDDSQEDERVGDTIWMILQQFFANSDNAVLYVCDSLDGRHLGRKRKFDRWFWRYDDGSIIKQDSSLADEDQDILSAILVHKENPNIISILDAFNELTEISGK